MKLQSSKSMIHPDPQKLKHSKKTLNFRSLVKLKIYWSIWKSKSMYRQKTSYKWIFICTTCHTNWRDNIGLLMCVDSSKGLSTKWPIKKRIIHSYLRCERCLHFVTFLIIWNSSCCKTKKNTKSHQVFFSLFTMEKGNWSDCGLKIQSSICTVATCPVLGWTVWFWNIMSTVYWCSFELDALFSSYWNHLYFILSLNGV